jgi:hypothetical protein
MQFHSTRLAVWNFMRQNIRPRWEIDRRLALAVVVVQL